MYLWNSKALSEELRTKRVSQREKMKYFLLFFVLSDVALGISPLLTKQATVTHAVEFLVGLVLTVGGIILCYQANRQGDDEAFIERFICMGLPISSRLTVLAIAISLPLMLITRIIIQPITPNYFEFMLKICGKIAFLIIYYWRVRYHLLKISGAMV